MSSIVRTRSVEAPAAEVWAVLADFGAIARWAPMVDHSCLMSGQTEGVGAVRRIQLGRTTLVERVTEWAPDSMLAYEIDGLPSVIRSVVNRWTIEPAADGRSTTVSITTEVDAGPRPPQQVVARAAGRRLAAASVEMLDGLDRQLTALGVTT